MQLQQKVIHRPGDKLRRRYTKWQPTDNPKRPEISEMYARMVNDMVVQENKYGGNFTFTDMVEQCIKERYEAQ